VARERRNLALLEAPPHEPENTCGTTSRAVRRSRRSGRQQVVGWCDIAVRPRSRSGTAGSRHQCNQRISRQGIGRALMQATLAAARTRGIRRIELTVRVDNEPAKRLYESFGFVTEGLCKRHMSIDGQFIDSWLMALLP
jgi:putative acetyltransferase